MRIEHSRLKEDTHRDVYWTVLHLLSDHSNKHSSVYICASYEYFVDHFKKVFTEDDLKTWLDARIEEWDKKGEDALSTEVHYDVYATTLEGKQNGVAFLKSKLN